MWVNCQKHHSYHDPSAQRSVISHHLASSLQLNTWVCHPNPCLYQPECTFITSGLECPFGLPYSAQILSIFRRPPKRPFLLEEVCYSDRNDPLSTTLYANYFHSQYPLLVCPYSTSPNLPPPTCMLAACWELSSSSPFSFMSYVKWVLNEDVLGLYSCPFPFSDSCFTVGLCCPIKL